MRKNNNSKYLLGVDVGNTKTHALITDISGEIVGFGVSGCGNHEVVGFNGLKKSINQSISRAIKKSGIQNDQIISMGFGISGYDWPSEEQLMIDAINSLGFTAPYQFVNDVVLGILIGTSESWGIAVDAGTSNNIRGRDKNGRIGRITGNSIDFGEFGGANEIIHKAIIAVTYAWSMRGSKTELTQMFLDYSKVTNEDLLIEGLALEKIKLDQSVVESIFEIALNGDRVANEVIQWSARELGLNVNSVVRQLQLQNDPFEVVLLGSVFRSGEFYIKPLRETIHEFAPDAKLILLQTLPVCGSIILAAENIGLSSQTLHDTLINHPMNINLLNQIN